MSFLTSYCGIRLMKMVFNNHLILFFEFYGLSFKVCSSLGTRKFGCGQSDFNGIGLGIVLRKTRMIDNIPITRLNLWPV